MIFISGPSTIGKNPLIYSICEKYNYEFITPYTTRKKRNEEKHMKDYYFLSKKEFKERIEKKEIEEWDYCLGNYYGYNFSFPGNKRQITHGLSRMVLRIKKKFPDDVKTIFLMPNDVNEIYERLKKIYNGTDLLLREDLVKEEICHSSMFDEVLFIKNSAIDLLDEEQSLKKMHLR